MRNRLALSALICMTALAGPVAAMDPIGTIERGEYECAMPGDATGQAWVTIPDKGFTIISASSYRAQGDGGTYLRSGDLVQFTRGPLKGMSLKLLGSGLLQEVRADGSAGRMRCHRVGRLPS